MMPASAVVLRRAARIRIRWVSMGLIPGAGGTVGIPRRIGRRCRLELAPSGRNPGAAEALSRGLVDALA